MLQICYRKDDSPRPWWSAARCFVDGRINGDTAFIALQFHKVGDSRTCY